MESFQSFSLSAFLIFLIGLYFVISAVLYVSSRIRFCHAKVWAKKEVVSSPGNRTLVVIAHPDDETMFFGPTILALLKRGPLYILCLSHGDHDGQGDLRKVELWKSCQALGIPSENVTLMKHEKLKDGPHNKWPIQHLATTIFNHLMAHQINILVTFDDYGISGHNNHIAIYKAVLDLIERNRIPTSCRVFTLESVNVFRKYMVALIDVPISFLFNEYAFVANGKARSLIRVGMECYESQMVWFRRLYLVFSRYLWINTLREISVRRQKTSSTPKQTDGQLFRIKDD